MSELVIKAVGMGMILSMLPGPAFFVLLQTSIKNGIKQAMAFDFGVLMADIVYIIIAYLFFAEVKALQSQQEYLKIAGGCVFLIFGSMLLMNKSIKFKKRKKKEERKIQNDDDNYVYLFFKGLFLNGFNPGLIFFWFTVIAVGTNQVDADGNKMLWYLSIILITFFSIDLLKIFGANSLQRFITPKFLDNLNKSVGIIIIGIGVGTIIMGIRDLM